MGLKLKRGIEAGYTGTSWDGEKDIFKEGTTCAPTR